MKYNIQSKNTPGILYDEQVREIKKVLCTQTYIMQRILQVQMISFC